MSDKPSSIDFSARIQYNPKYNYHAEQAPSDNPGEQRTQVNNYIYAREPEPQKRARPPKNNDEYIGQLGMFAMEGHLSGGIVV